MDVIAQKPLWSQGFQSTGKPKGDFAAADDDDSDDDDDDSGDVDDDSDGDSDNNIRLPITM